jgi:hypothetical protein
MRPIISFICSAVYFGGFILGLLTAKSQRPQLRFRLEISMGSFSGTFVHFRAREAVGGTRERPALVTMSLTIFYICIKLLTWN